MVGRAPVLVTLLAVTAGCGPATPSAKPTLLPRGPTLTKIAADAQPIVDAWAAAVGGRDAIAALGPLHAKGTYERGGLRGTIELWLTPRGERREQIQLGALREVRIFDGARGWLVDRNREVRELAGGELDDQLALAFRDAWAPLVVDRRPGTVTRDGDRLVLAPDGGHRPETIELDQVSHVPQAILRREAEKQRTTWLSDWNPVAGVRLPFTIREETGNPNEAVTIHFKTLEPAVPVPSAFTQPPDREPDMQLASNPLSVPIEVAYGGFIFVKVSINDAPMSFILDTGAEATVLNSSRVSKLGLQAFGTFATGAGGGDVVLSYVPHVTTKVGGATLADQMIAAILLDHLEPALKRPIDGILGYDFLSRFVVELDYVHQTMRLHERGSYHHTGAGTAIAIMLEEGTPSLTAAITVPDKGDIAGRFVLDTGCLCEVHLFTPFVDDHKLLSAFPNAKQAGFSAGAGGTINQLTTPIPALKIGGQTITGVTAELARDKVGATATPETAGLIGSLVWRHFVLVLDYKAKQIFMDPVN